MLIDLNKLIRSRDSLRGQVALVLILVLAVLLIFFAIVLNLGRVAELKTLVTLASNQSAALMASSMASYAQNYYESMGGKDKLGDDLTRCNWNFTPKAFLGAIASMFTGNLLLIIQQFARLVIAPRMDQLVISLWNKQMNILGPVDRFVESGLVASLRMAIDDVKSIEDTDDIDLDGLWGANDHVSRFNYAYTQRLRQLIKEKHTFDEDVIKGFQEALKDFLKKETDNWGIWDSVWDTCDTGAPHACCSNNSPVPECNPCCLPNGTNGEPNYRPSCCDAAADSCGTTANCPFSTGYPYVFDPFYENSSNGFVSFREFLSRDDENRYLKGNPPVLDPAQKYRIDDTQGGLYPFLWKVSDRMPLSPVGTNCFWCDARYPGCSGSAGLTLPENCTINGIGNCCLKEGTDRVGDIPNMLIRNNECYNPDDDPSWWKKGAPQYCSTQWPYNINCPGQSCPAPSTCNYCSETAPCISDEESECATSPTKDFWVGDSVDEVLYGLKEFIEWADRTIEKDPGAIAAIFSFWYPEVESWISIDPGNKGTLLLWSKAIDSWKTGVSDWRNYNGYKGQLSSDICFPSPAAGGPNSVTIPNVITCLESQRVHWAGLQTRYNNLVNQRNAILAQITTEQRLLNNLITLRNTLNTCNNQCLATGDALLLSRPCWILCPTCLPRYFQIHGGPTSVSDFLFDPISYEVCGPTRNPDFLDVFLFNQRRATENAITQKRALITSLQNQAASLLVQIQAITPEMLAQANNNAEMYRFRRDFMQTAYDEAGTITSRLDTAINKFLAFLNDPRVRDLKAEWERVLDWSQDPQAAPFAIYGWQGDPPEGRGEGYWHIVRADARLPGRCGGKCQKQSFNSPEEAGWHWGEPFWPWPRKWRNTSGLKTCTSLQDSVGTFANRGGSYNLECDSPSELDNARACFRGGTVKSRVIRYDENKDTRLKFANTIPFWRFVFHHPGQGEPAGDLSHMQQACDPPPRKGYFMVNRYGSSGEQACYNATREFLERGVKSETCAEYFFHDRPTRGFSLKFTKCQGEF